jgi:hypothetical protein
MHDKAFEVLAEHDPLLSSCSQNLGDKNYEQIFKVMYRKHSLRKGSEPAYSSWHMSLRLVGTLKTPMVEVK